MWENIKDFNDEDKEDIEDALYELSFSRNVGLDRVIKFTRYNMDIFAILTDENYYEFKITADYLAFANMVIDGKDYPQPFEQIMQDNSGNYDDARAIANETFNAIKGFDIKYWSGEDSNGNVIWKTAKEIQDAQL